MGSTPAQYMASTPNLCLRARQETTPATPLAAVRRHTHTCTHTHTQCVRACVRERERERERVKERERGTTRGGAGSGHFAVHQRTLAVSNGGIPCRIGRQNIFELRASQHRVKIIRLPIRPPLSRQRPPCAAACTRTYPHKRRARARERARERERASERARARQRESESE